MAKRLLSPLQFATALIFVSVALVFISVTFLENGCSDFLSVLSSLALGLFRSFRVFILEGDMDEAPRKIDPDPNVWVSLWMSALCVIAPILTFGNVLSLLGNLKDEVKYAACKGKKRYILSELNVKSIALAKSIRKHDTNAVIVFADVFEKNNTLCCSFS